MSGRAKGEISRDRYQKIWWYSRHGYSQRATARRMGLALGTVQFYLGKGIPPYDRFYDTDSLPADLRDEALDGLVPGRPANDRPTPRLRASKPVVSRSPASRPKVVDINTRRGRA